MSSCESNIKIRDVKYSASWSPQEATKISKLFQRIRNEPDYGTRIHLIKGFENRLGRKYNDQTISKDLVPDEVGQVIDRVLSAGCTHIAKKMAGKTEEIPDHFAAGDSANRVLFGNSSLGNEMARSGSVFTNGYLEASGNSWSSSAEFPRSTVSFVVREAGMTIGSDGNNFLQFDRSVFTGDSVITHIQGEKAFTITGIYGIYSA